MRSFQLFEHGIETADSDSMGCQLRNSRMLASWPHSRCHGLSLCLSGSYIILRGMLYSPRRHSHTYTQLGVFRDPWEREELQNFYLFIYLFLVLGKSQENLTEKTFFQKLSKIIFEYLKWQDSSFFQFFCRSATLWNCSLWHCWVAQVLLELDGHPVTGLSCFNLSSGERNAISLQGEGEWKSLQHSC